MLARKSILSVTVILALLFSLPLLHLLIHALTNPLPPVLPLVQPLANSLFLASFAALASTLLAALTAYALIAHPFPYRRHAMLLLLALASLPPQLLLPGGFELITRLHLFDSHLALLLPASLNLFAVLLYRAAFMAVPQDLLASARIDGCSELSAFWHIALPAVLPTTSALLLLSFTATYNATVWPAITLQSPHLQTLSTVLATSAGTALTPQDHARLTTLTAVALLPPICLFLSLQKGFLPTLRGVEK
jgi:ABC-type glycerol-3-phosphate transport system permease component